MTGWARVAIAGLAVFPLFCSAPGMRGAQAAPAQQVILISVDGMTPVEYTDAAGHGLKIPNLLALRNAGCSSPGALGVFPASTYPSHTSMITGQPPAVHGIVSNTPIDPLNLEFGGWYYYAEAIRAPTLWQALHAAHLATAAVSWPVTVGAGVDFLLPEYRPVRTAEDIELMHVRSPPGRVAEIEERDRAEEPMSDAWRTGAAITILETRRPALLALHLSDLDEVEHRFGPDSAEAHAQLEKIDEEIGRIRSSVERSGRAGQTAWLIVSDHGFLPVQHYYHPLIALRDAGLIMVDRGRITGWKVYFRNSTGSFFLEAKDSGDAESIAKATGLMRDAAADPGNGIAHVYTPEQIRQMGGDPRAFLAVEAEPGFGVGGNLEGPRVTPSSSRGAHGFRPGLEEMRASFILSGAGVAACPRLEGVTLEDVGPTAAALLGTAIPGAQGQDVRRSGKQ
jgi:predicted AlkP superfamily pyrophosphatase or phosphodiesterase